MQLGIDASNIRAGGGVTHLDQVLRAANPAANGIDRIVVWSSQSTLSKLPDASWLAKRTEPVLESNYVARAIWQWRRLGALAREEGCDLLFVPGGSYAGDFQPVVTMSQNLLPFEWRELARYGCSLTALRLMLLRWTQGRSFRNADGMIFLTRYAQQSVTRAVGRLGGVVRVIPHGIDPSFFPSADALEMRAARTEDRTLQILYVSIVDVYKHQWHVAEAVALLRARGLAISLKLIGPAYAPALTRLRKVLQRLDPGGTFLRYEGPVPHHELPKHYRGADVGVFASSCENMPNILLECMAAGLPIACSDHGAVRELLGEAGVYFDPESPSSIAAAVEQLLRSGPLRREKATLAASQAQQYSWERCARETFAFFKELVSRRHPAAGET